jgi:hypothetical protein
MLAVVLSRQIEVLRRFFLAPLQKRRYTLKVYFNANTQTLMNLKIHGARMHVHYHLIFYRLVPIFRIRLRFVNLSHLAMDCFTAPVIFPVIISCNSCALLPRNVQRISCRLPWLDRGCRASDSPSWRRSWWRPPASPPPPPPHTCNQWVTIVIVHGGNLDTVFTSWP